MDIFNGLVPKRWCDKAGSSSPPSNWNITVWLSDFHQRCGHIEKVLIQVGFLSIDLECPETHQLILELDMGECFCQHFTTCNNQAALFCYDSMYTSLIRTCTLPIYHHLVWWPVWNPCISCAGCAPLCFRCCTNFSHKKMICANKYIYFCLFVLGSAPAWRKKSLDCSELQSEAKNIRNGEFGCPKMDVAPSFPLNQC